MLLFMVVDNYEGVEVLVCGGVVEGVYNNLIVQYDVFNMCGCINFLVGMLRWVMEIMFQWCIMGDMILVFMGGVIIINGVSKGLQGWGFVSDFVCMLVLYSLRVVVG